MHLPILVVIVSLLVACAAGPPTAPLVPPPNLVSGAVDTYLGRELAWGGMVIETVNFERHSEIEVLAFPLDRRGQPRTDTLDLGRFVILRAGFVDPAVYAPGRLVTANGRITGDRRGVLGEASYRWPELDANELQLWAADHRHTRPRFTFSLGVGIRR